MSKYFIIIKKLLLLFFYCVLLRVDTRHALKSLICLYMIDINDKILDRSVLSQVFCTICLTIIKVVILYDCEIFVSDLRQRLLKNILDSVLRRKEYLFFVLYLKRKR